jgi:hypothetical protein
MKTQQENRPAWEAYLGTLAWVKGQLDVSSWWAFLRAGSCGVDSGTALEVVAARIAAAGSAVRQGKLLSQCRRAYAHVRANPNAGMAWRPRAAFAPVKAKPSFDLGKLRAFSADWAAHVDAVWLGNRSSVDPAAVSTGQFLDEISEPGDALLLFSTFQSQGQFYWVSDPYDASWYFEEVGAPVIDHRPKRQLTEEEVVGRLSGADGVWFLAQPVDMQEHVNPRERRLDGRAKLSRRSQEAVTSWRYLVLESDEAPARSWLGALVQLPLRIVAIYTSGGKSVHALVRVDAVSKAHWDAFREAVLPGLTILGADPAAVTAVRLTRLPGCRRAGKLQKLLYLNPRASGLLPICALPPRRDVVDGWKRYAESCPGDEDAMSTSEWAAIVRRGLEHYAPCSEVLAGMLGNVKASS